MKYASTKVIDFFPPSKMNFALHGWLHLQEHVDPFIHMVPMAEWPSKNTKQGSCFLLLWKPWPMAISLIYTAILTVVSSSQTVGLLKGTVVTIRTSEFVFFVFLDGDLISTKPPNSSDTPRLCWSAKGIWHFAESTEITWFSYVSVLYIYYMII